MRELNQWHKRKHITRFAAMLMSVCLFATGCGKQAEDIPELIEPISTNEAYRPVEYGDIGNKVIKMGEVVPTEYCHFYTTSATIVSINVSVGDYVEAGDVLAEVSQETAGQTIEDLKASLDYQTAVHEINENIFNENQKKWDYQIRAAEESGDIEGADTLRIQKAVEAENHRYSNVLYERQILELNESITEQQEIQENNQLVARHAGYVTYVKDTSDSSMVSSAENIVIVSDYNDTYIELPDETVKGDIYGAFGVMYTIIGGQKYDIEEYKYSNKELAAAQSNKAYPNVRFQLKDAEISELLTAGDSIPLYFNASDVSNVLIIGNDSVYQEGDSAFVYVKGENGEKEKRTVTLGSSDTHSVEVVEGLSEGEMVYYSSDVIMPASYAEYEVTLSDFSITSQIPSNSQTMIATDIKYYTAAVEGKITSLQYYANNTVNKGEILFTIDSGGGSAELRQAELEIEHAQEEYAASIEDANAEIASLAEQRQMYESGELPEEPTATDTDAEEASNTLYMSEQLGCDYNIAVYNKQLLTLEYNNKAATLNANYNKLKENNDGYGNMNVYADKDGTIIELNKKEGDSVEAGEKILSVGTEESKKLAVVPKETTQTIGINQKVKVVSKIDESIQLEGVCIGTTANTSKTYITTIDGEVYITNSLSNNGTLQYFIEVDDESFYEAPESYNVKCNFVEIDNTIVIPKSLVYTETDKTTGSVYNYVWKIMDGELVKQYVSLDDTLDDELSLVVLSGVSEGDILARETGK